MTAATTSIQQLFKQVEAAGASFFAGDPAPIIALWSRGNDVTIFGGSGSYAQGWQAVEPRIRWAAAHFRGGRRALEAVTMGESGDLVYTISIEWAKCSWRGVRNSARLRCASHNFTAVKMVPGRSSIGMPIRWMTAFD